MTTSPDATIGRVFRAWPLRTRVALALVVIVLLSSIAAPWLAPYDPAAQLDVVALKNAPPSVSHLLGTDPYSRDMLARALFGSRASLLIGLAGAAVAASLSLGAGAVAALQSERGGDLLMGAVDAMRAIPRKIILLAVLVVMPQPSLLALALVLGATSWMPTSRVIFSQVRALRSREYVAAAQATGVPRARIMLRHIAPHLFGTLASASAILVADLLTLEAGLSFLGLGVQPPTASWGTMLQDGVPHLSTAWWVAATPCALLVSTVLCVSHLAHATYASERRPHH